MAEKMTFINPDMLVWAREQSGTTLQQAKNKFGDVITNWESGEDFPTLSKLRDLGSFYSKPIAVFFFPEPPKLKDIKSSFRTLSSGDEVFGRDIVRCIDWARNMQLNLYEIHDDNNPAQNKITNIDFSNYQNDISAISSQLRILLKAPIKEQKEIKKSDEAFEYWRERFLNIGVFVFKNAFKADNVSGFCLYDDEFPIVCVNNSLAHNRQIFTLFHEVFHLIRRTSGMDFLDDSVISFRSEADEYNEIEVYCNRFAGAFLVPDDDFRKNTSNIAINDYSIQSLADLYSVSREVILRKFRDSKKITQQFYEEKVEEYKRDFARIEKIGVDGKKQGGGNYYATQMTYVGYNYAERVFSKYYERKISLQQLATYMNMKVPSVQQLVLRKGWGSL